MKDVSPPQNAMECLGRLQDRAERVVLDRSEGGRRWHGLHIVLGVTSLVLGATASAAIFGDLATGSPQLKLALGLAALVAGIAGSLTSLLRTEDRMIRNKVELAIWRDHVVRLGVLRGSAEGLDEAALAAAVRAVSEQQMHIAVADAGARTGRSAQLSVQTAVPTAPGTGEHTPDHCREREYDQAPAPQSAITRADRGLSRRYRFVSGPGGSRTPRPARRGRRGRRSSPTRG